MIAIAIFAGFVILAFTYNAAQTARNNLYKKEQEEWRKMEYDLYNKNEPDTKSPYYLVQNRHSETKKWGYTIKDKRTGVYVSANGFHQIHYTMQAAQIAMNQLEIIGGFDKTVLEILETPEELTKKETA